jgi:hypothetical protein
MIKISSFQLNGAGFANARAVLPDEVGIGEGQRPVQVDAQVRAGGGDGRRR